MVAFNADQLLVQRIEEAIREEARHRRRPDRPTASEARLQNLLGHSLTPTTREEIITKRYPHLIPREFRLVFA